MDKSEFQPNIGGMAEAALDLAIAVLWPVRALSPIEKENMRRRIRFLLFSQEDHFNAYMEFCQRVLLYREYIMESKEDIFYALPLAWMQPGNGYSVARVLYKEIQVKRLKARTYRQDLKWIAEAVLEITEGVDGAFEYWEKWFRDRKCTTGLRIFYLFTAIRVK